MDYRLAVFTVQTLDLTPEELAPVLARLGYDGVEWRITQLPAQIPADRNYWNGNVCAFEIDHIEAETARIRSLADEHGLALPTLGTYLDPARLEQVESCLRAAKSLSVPMLRVGLPAWDHKVPHSVALGEAVRLWEPVVDLGRRYGVRILAELHHGGLIPSAGAAFLFLRHWLPEDVGAIYDPGNMVFEGWEHPDVSIGVLGAYLAHVHVKNARWRQSGEDQGTARWRGEMCRLREGQIHWPEVLASLRRAGYDGWLATEDFGAGDSLEKLADNITALRAW